MNVNAVVAGPWCPQYLILGAGVALLVFAGAARAVDAPLGTPAPSVLPAPPIVPPATRTQLLYDLDPYYSSLDWQVPLTSSPVPEGGKLPESEVYKRLFRDSLRPRILLLEASVYPLPAVGTWLKGNSPNFYNDFKVGNLGNNPVNLLDLVTAGFQEPWAVSAFTGSTMRFTDENSTSTGNRGYMGYLVSFGTKHILDNTLIDDNWWEFEWKLKGERKAGDEDLGWSFRIGVKNHGNPWIRDVAYVGLRRTNLEYSGTLLSFLDNSDLETLTECDRSTGRFLRQEITVGKEYPLKSRRMFLGLDMGVIYQSAAEYSGPLTQLQTNTVTFVLRPNLHF